MLTRRQIEALCLGCDSCEGIRIHSRLLYIVLEGKVLYINHDKIRVSGLIDMFTFKQMQKINHINDLRNYLTVYYPSLK